MPARKQRWRTKAANDTAPSRPVSADNDADGSLDSTQVPEPGAEMVMHQVVAPEPRLNLSEDGERLVVKLTFRYGTASPVSPSDPRALVGGGAQILRVGRHQRGLRERYLELLSER